MRSKMDEDIEAAIMPHLTERTDLLQRTYGVSREDIYRLRRKYKVKQEHAAELFDAVFCLYVIRQGLSLEEMVAKYAIPSSTIRLSFKKHGLPNPNSRGRGDKAAVEAARFDIRAGAFEWEVYERNAISVRQFYYLRKGEGKRMRCPRPKQST